MTTLRGGEVLTDCPACGARISLSEAACTTYVVLGDRETAGYVCPNCDRPFIRSGDAKRPRHVRGTSSEDAVL